MSKTNSGAEDPGAAAGWSVANTGLEKGPTDTEWTTSTSSGMIAIVGYETIDYDLDNDGLIEIASAAQLNAVRWDLDGDGVTLFANEAQYESAFPNRAQGMGCPRFRCSGYELTADIDLGVAPHNAGTGWTPMGGAGGGFLATLEGNGHTVSGLTINNTADGMYGLFGIIGGTVRNLAIIEPSITVGTTGAVGGTNAGALAGQVSGTLSRRLRQGWRHSVSQRRERA